MKNKIMFLVLMSFLFVGFGFGRECQTIEDPSSGCDILTFTVNASDVSQVFTDAVCTINITDTTGSDSEATMTAGSLGSGWHNYTFQESVVGVYPIQIECTKSGKSSRTSDIITIAVSSQTYLSEINSTTNAIRDTDVVTITNNQDTLSTQISNTNTSIITQGDSAWVTATGFSTYEQVATVNDTTKGLNVSTYNYFISGSNEDQFKADVSSLATSTELTTTQGIIETAIDQNQSETQTRGDSAWITATGFSTHSAVDVDTQLNLSHSSGNWSNTDVTTTLSLTQNDFNNISRNVWDYNGTGYLSFNSSSVPYKFGDYTALTYNTCWYGG